MEIKCVRHFLILLEFWSLIFSQNKNNLKELWHAGKTKNMLKDILLENFMQDKISNGSRKCELLREILNIVEKSFGSNWDEIFSKIPSKAISIKVIENNSHSEYYENLLKLLILAKYNYENSEVQSLFKVHFYDSCLLKNISEEFGIPILREAIQIYDSDKKMMLSVIVKFLEYSPVKNTELILTFLCDIIENTFKDDEKFIKYLLFHHYSFDKHPLFLASSMQDVKYFEQLSNYYIKYKKDLLRLFTLDYELPKIISNVSQENQSNFINFVIKIFKGHTEQILNFVCDDHQICFDLIINDYTFEFITALSNKLFCDNLENANKFIRKFLFCNCSEENHPLILALESKNIKSIKNIKNRYNNLNISGNDLAVIFRTSEKLMKTLQFINNEEVFEELVEILNDILINKEERRNVARGTKKYLERKNSEEISEDKLKYLKKFYKMFSED